MSFVRELGHELAESLVWAIGGALAVVLMRQVLRASAAETREVLPRP